MAEKTEVLVVLVAMETKPEQVRVPDVLKRNRKQAQAILKKEGLTIGTLEGRTDGIVSEESPSAQSLVPANSAVNLVFVMPAKPPKVPAVGQQQIEVPSTYPPSGLWTEAKGVAETPAALTLEAIVLGGVFWWAVHRSPKPVAPVACRLRTTRARTSFRNREGKAPKIAMRVDLRHRAAARIVTTRASRVALKGANLR